MILKAAIAIVTLNRHLQLEDTLNYLAKIDLSRVLEILIVDQTDIPVDLSFWQPKFPIPLRLLHLSVKGLCVARNQAYQHTTADVIIYLDDDVIPSFELATQHLLTYQEYPQAIAVAGSEELPSGVGSPLWKQKLRQSLLMLLRPYFKISQNYRYFLDSEGYPVAIITKSGLFLCDFNRFNPCRVMTVRGCNMSFLRSALIAIQGFDEGHIGNVRREESDASLRLLQAFPDKEIRFNPQAKLIHLMSPTGGCRFTTDRDWYIHLFLSEARFARRHLSSFGYIIFCLRFILLQSKQLLRYPSLVNILLDAREVGLPG
jgi:glycosyltransferase involved in cell wall biosynthesis